MGSLQRHIRRQWRERKTASSLSELRRPRNSWVVSTGRRNTCIKSFCWGFNSQGFTWPFVELTHHFV